MSPILKKATLGQKAKIQNTNQKEYKINHRKREEGVERMIKC